MRKCDICNKTDEGSEADDVYMYGEWMTKYKVTVHYFCLMFSTHLPQRGGDSSGILGFMIRDIRKEIQAAQLRKCIYCRRPGASVECHKCHKIFHLACGMESHSVNYFRDDFRSYCKDCAPRDQYQKQLMAAPHSVFQNLRCDICFGAITVFVLSKVVYGDCCRKGFAHKTCMRRYAYSSGYYLRCLWCGAKEFHETIKLQSVFVPDRDATWELQKNAYRELHSKPLHCDEKECLCPKGRNYSNNYKWNIKFCITCAAYGSHFKCRKDGAKDFKCEFCKEIEANMQKSKNSNKEQNSQNSNIDQTNTKSQLDTTLYLPKNSSESPPLASDDEALHATDEESSSNEASIVTVIASQLCKTNILEPAETLAPTGEVSVETPTAEFAIETPTSSPAAEAEVAVEASVIELPDSQMIEFRLPQPPLLLCKSFTHGEHFYVQVYDYQEQYPERCVGTWTFRFPLNDARIQDCSEQALEQLQPTMRDVWTRNGNRGIYDKIDQYTM